MANSPTFVAHFADGQLTRMSTFTSLDKLDVKRGVHLSQWAYRSRMRCEPPAITEASFELNGTTLATYDAEALKGVQDANRSRPDFKPEARTAPTRA
jgi:hypothetical protein